jgi:hypothetical protein
MKRLLYSAIILLLASCSREIIPEIPENQDTPETGNTYTVTLTASMDPETRITINAENGIGQWDNNDEIALFTDNGKRLKGTISQNSSTKATFTFTVDEGDAIKEGAIAYYPFSISDESDPSVVNLPTSYDDPDIQYRSVPMRAVLSSDGSLVFKHLASLIHVTLSSAIPSYPDDSRKPKWVVLETNQNVSGSFTVNSDLTLTSPGGDSKYVRAQYVEGKTYLFPIPSGTYRNGFSLSIKADDGFVYYKKNKSSDFTATRAKMVKMPSFDVQCKEFYLTGTETGWSTTDTRARMIQAGPNVFVGAMNSWAGEGGEKDKGLKILQKFNLVDGSWNYVIGHWQDGKANYGDGMANFAAGATGVFKITLTLNQGVWNYACESVGEATIHNELFMVVSLGDNTTDLSHGEHIAFTRLVPHNWKTQIVVSSSTIIHPDTDYAWRLYIGDWYVQWGRISDDRGFINNNQLYSSLDWDNEHCHNCTLNLSAGTYDVYFNDCCGQIMFIKK